MVPQNSPELRRGCTLTTDPTPTQAQPPCLMVQALVQGSQLLNSDTLMSKLKGPQAGGFSKAASLERTDGRPGGL